MTTNDLSNWMRGRAMAVVACAALAAPMIGCGSGGGANASGANQPPVNDYQGGGMSARPTAMGQPAPQQHGLTGKQKVVLLVGAAALYYLYRKHQKNAQNAAANQQGQPVYYLSKNGQVYYRDASARVHYVTPPPQGIQVPYDEAQQYQGLQGYDNSSTGITDLSRFAAQNGGM